MARPLPKNFLSDLVQRKRLLLCLDFDGVIAPTVDEPASAKPVQGAREVIGALTRLRDDVIVAIASGRSVPTVRRMLGIFSGLYFIGLHGIEIADPYDRLERLVQIEHCLPALQTVRDWLRKQARDGDGFMLEDKEFALALHYRNVDPEVARDLARQLEYFVAHMIHGLRVLHGDMVIEVLPSNAGGKGFAINHLLGQLKDRTLVPVFFGNDLSDEEAFFAVRRAAGVTILVGDDRETHAEFRLDAPEDVLGALTSLCASLGDSASAAPS